MQLFCCLVIGGMTDPQTSSHKNYIERKVFLYGGGGLVAPTVYLISPNQMCRNSYPPNSGAAICPTSLSVRWPRRSVQGDGNKFILLHLKLFLDFGGNSSRIKAVWYSASLSLTVYLGSVLIQMLIVISSSRN